MTDGPSAAVQQQADDEADRGGDADRLPGMVVDVVVGGARGVLGAVDRLPFEFLQPQLGVQQLGLDLLADVARLVAGFAGGRFSISSASLRTFENSSTTLSRVRSAEWSWGDSF